jgi:hypothetical protein
LDWSAAEPMSRPVFVEALGGLALPLKISGQARDLAQVAPPRRLPSSPTLLSGSPADSPLRIIPPDTDGQRRPEPVHHGRSHRCGGERRPSVGGRRGASRGRVEAEPGAGDQLNPEDSGPAPPAQPHRLLLQLRIPSLPAPTPVSSGETPPFVSASSGGVCVWVWNT